MKFSSWVFIIFFAIVVFVYYILPEKYKNHPLHGNYEGWNDCHILPDWILVWRYDNDELVLCLLDTGSHSDLFK